MPATTASLATSFPFKDPTPVIEKVKILADGKVLSVAFDVQDKITVADGRAFFDFHFNSAWLHFSSPLLIGPQYYRRHPAYAPKVCPGSKVVSAHVVKNGVVLRFESVAENGQTYIFQDTYPACFLFAYAPFTGLMKSAAPECVDKVVRALKEDPLAKALADVYDISLINCYAAQQQKPWNRYEKGHPQNVMGHEQLKEIPKYDAESLRTDKELKKKLYLDVCVNYGVAAVYNVKPPSSYDEASGEEMVTDWFSDVFGKPNQHRARHRSTFNIHSKYDKMKVVSTDYDLGSSLPMHTDGVNYASSRSFVQVNYQVIANVETKVVDLYACVDYLREKYPDYYKVLTTAPVSFGMRHELYNRAGTHSLAKKDQKELYDELDTSDIQEMELLNTVPMINVEKNVALVRNEDGQVCLESKEMPTRVTVSPAKLGVCAIPPTEFDQFMAAFSKWYDIVQGNEDGIQGATMELYFPQDTYLLFNNDRLAHERANILDDGLQKHVYRTVDDLSSVTSTEEEVFGSEVAPTDKSAANVYRRQMVGAYQNRPNMELQLRLLTMKLLEKELGDELDMELYSEFNEIKKNGTVQAGADMMAKWFPRSPSKVLERMMPH